MARRASINAREPLGAAHPPVGQPPSFTASDGRQVWEIKPNVFLVQRDVGTDAADICVPVVFDVPAETTDAVMRLKGIAFGLAMSLPIWAITLWAVRRLFGGG
jgi:hypothetical protein